MRRSAGGSRSRRCGAASNLAPGRGLSRVPAQLRWSRRALGPHELCEPAILAGEGSGCCAAFLLPRITTVPKSQTADEQWLAAFQADLMRRDAAIHQPSISNEVEFDKRARALDVEWTEAISAPPSRLIKDIRQARHHREGLVSHPRTGLFIQHGDAAHSVAERSRSLSPATRRGRGQRLLRPGICSLFGATGEAGKRNEFASDATSDRIRNV